MPKKQSGMAQDWTQNRAVPPRCRPNKNSMMYQLSYWAIPRKEFLIALKSQIFVPDMTPQVETIWIHLQDLFGLFRQKIVFSNCFPNGLSNGHLSLLWIPLLFDKFLLCWWLRYSLNNHLYHRCRPCVWDNRFRSSRSCAVSNLTLTFLWNKIIKNRHTNYIPM